jgi:hypothetical protein
MDLSSSGQIFTCVIECIKEIVQLRNLKLYHYIIDWLIKSTQSCILPAAHKLRSQSLLNLGTDAQPGQVKAPSQERHFPGLQTALSRGPHHSNISHVS